MTTRAARTFILITALAAGSLSACDMAEQNYDYRPGDALDIESVASGQDVEVVVPDTAEYFVRAFTINKDYTWTVNGSPPDSVWRGGEYIAVYFDEPGTYTIEVNDGEEYAGTLEVTGVLPEGE